MSQSFDQDYGCPNLLSFFSTPLSFRLRSLSSLACARLADWALITIQTRDAKLIPKPENRCRSRGISCVDSQIAGGRLHPAPRISSEERYTLLANDRLRVEVLYARNLSRTPAEAVHSPECQMLLPLAGHFNWHLGKTTPALIDTNRVVMIAADDVSQDSHPTLGDAVALLLTPAPVLLDEIWSCPADAAGKHRLFRQRIRVNTPALQLAGRELIRLSAATFAGDDAEIEDCSMCVMRQLAATGPVSAAWIRGANNKLVVNAKAILHENAGRLRLAEIAQELGVSAPYLTDIFRRSEGMPLARYHMRLRMARALEALPSADDITQLAFTLGFSSHAHFSAAFKRCFGLSPSAYRAQHRKNLKAPRHRLA